MHLAAARRDELIAAMAAALQHHSGGGPLAEALLWLLPALGPLTWLIGQALWLAQPALAGWVDPARLAEWALLFEEPALGERLAARLADASRRSA
jgi:hypothetical protein